MHICTCIKSPVDLFIDCKEYREHHSAVSRLIKVSMTRIFIVMQTRV